VKEPIVISQEKSRAQAARSVAVETRRRIMERFRMRRFHMRKLRRPTFRRPVFQHATPLSPRVLGKRLLSRVDHSSLRGNHIAEAVTQVCRTHTSGGNALLILENGIGTYAAMLHDIGAAISSINFENYIFESDATGWEFANALAERALAGVSVNLLYDAIGSANASADMWAFLAGAGVNVRAFHPLSEGLARAQIRDHRKLLIVDGRIGYIGGHCIGNCWSGRNPGEGAWRDTHVRLEGPAVADLQRTFCECWAEAGGQECAADDPRFFPPLESRGSLDVMTLTCGEERGMRQAYLEMFKQARKRILIANAYFCPDEELRAALKAAARRGVRVRIIVPSKSDHEIMIAAARSTYADLLNAGVEIYEYQPTMLHAKTALVDGCWATVGSCNLDSRSLSFNYEANIGISSRRIVRTLERTFKRDLRRSERIRPEHWRRRPFVQKVAETLVSMISRQL
jgi:cardiolipin synthase